MAGPPSGVLIVWLLPNNNQAAPFVSPAQATLHRQGSFWRTEKRAPSAMWESSHRAESPRPAGDFRKLRALALLPGACQLQQQYLPVMAESASIIAPGAVGESSHRAETPRPARCDIRGPWHYYRTRAESQRQYLPVMTLNASIIAPGRDGSQLSAPPPKLVSTQAANGGGEGQPLAA